MYNFHILFLIGLIVSSSSVVVRRRGKPSTTPRIGGRKSDLACDIYGSNVKTRMYPYMDISPFAANGEFPHLAAIFEISPLNEKIIFVAAGVLISSDYVLSVGQMGSRRNITKVRLGTVVSTTDMSSGLVINVERLIIHPYHKRNFQYHDIALVELSEKVKFTFLIQPACLYTYPFDLGDLLMTSPGWGIGDLRSEWENPLQIAEFSLFDRETCKITYPSGLIQEGLNDSHICVIDKKKETAHCMGDSGSPLQFISDENGMYTIVGLSSFGIGCDPDIPAVFTNVTTHLDWIESIVWP